MSRIELFTAEGWTQAADDDGLIEMRGPHDMSVLFSKAYSDLPLVYFRGHWESLYSKEIMSPLTAAWKCFEEGRNFQPKPKGYRHGLPEQETK